MYCTTCPQNSRVENLYHLFIGCPRASEIWDVIWPSINQLTRNNPFNIQKLILNIHSTNLHINIRRMINTILQITMHRIWINRNSWEKDHARIPLNESLARIRLAFSRAIRRKFRELSPDKFRERYCHTPHICDVRNGGLFLNLI